MIEIRHLPGMLRHQPAPDRVALGPDSSPSSRTARPVIDDDTERHAIEPCHDAAVERGERASIATAWHWVGRPPGRPLVEQVASAPGLSHRACRGSKSSPPRPPSLRAASRYSPGTRRKPRPRSGREPSSGTPADDGGPRTSIVQASESTSLSYSAWPPRPSAWAYAALTSALPPPRKKALVRDRLGCRRARAGSARRTCQPGSASAEAGSSSAPAPRRSLRR